MKILGIGGTNGSGKDLASEILANDYGWRFISVSRDLFIPELKRRGEPLERANMAALTTEWREKYSMGVVIDKAIELAKQIDSRVENIVISSLRHPGEADQVHELGGQVIWIDADPQVRYERIYNRGQDDKDQKTFEQFLAEEKREMTHAGDEATLSMAGVKAKADIFIDNNTNNLNDFKKAIQKALNFR